MRVAGPRRRFRLVVRSRGRLFAYHTAPGVTKDNEIGGGDDGREDAAERIVLTTDDPIAMYRVKAAIKAGLFARARRAPKNPRIERFSLIQMIGRGGFGTVFRAHDPKLERDVAIKVVPLDPDADDDATMLQEGRTMARLRHPSLVHVYDVGICDATGLLGPDAGRCLYIVMELLEGSSLREWVKQRPRSVEEIFLIMLQVGEGMAAAHAKDVVHLDLKPSNIHVDESCATVLDFGLSRVIESEPTRDVESEPAVTHVFGTPRYMAPEQHQGSRPGPAADQFALAVCIFEALFEHHPFAGSSVVELAADKLAGPPLVPHRAGVGRRRRSALRRALEPEPEARFPSMQAFVQALAPARSRRWAGLMTAAVVGVAATSWFGASVSSSRCEGEQARSRRIWGPEVAERIEAGFGAVPVEYAEEARTRVQDRLDDRSQAWAQARHEACLERDDGDSRPSAGINCLERYYEQAIAVVEVLEEPDRLTLRNLDQVLAGLDGLERCERAQQLPPAPAWLIDDASRGLEIHGRIVRARALSLVGRREQARALVEDAVADAQQLGAHELEAEASAVHCQSFRGLDDRTRAKEACAHAMVASERALRPDLSFMVLLHQVGLLDVFELDMMAHTVDLAEAKRRQLGPDPLLDARLAWSRSNVDVNRGRYSQALAAQRRVRQIFREEYGVGSPSDISISNSIALLLMSMGDLEIAKQELRRLLPRLRRVDGPDQPREAAILNNLGRAGLRSGDLDSAKVALERALELKERHFGEESEAVLTTRSNLVRVLAALGDRRGALAMLDRTLAIVGELPGRSSEQAMFEAMALGIGGAPGDVRVCEELREIFERVSSDMNDNSLVSVGLETARCFIDNRAPDSAQAVLEVLMEFHEQWALELLDLHEVQRGLAWCAYQRGHDDVALRWLERAASEGRALPPDESLTRSLQAVLRGEPAPPSDRARRWLER